MLEPTRHSQVNAYSIEPDDQDTAVNQAAVFSHSPENPTRSKSKEFLILHTCRQESPKTRRALCQPFLLVRQRIFAKRKPSPLIIPVFCRDILKKWSLSGNRRSVGSCYPRHGVHLMLRLDAILAVLADSTSAWSQLLKALKWRTAVNRRTAKSTCFIKYYQ